MEGENMAKDNVALSPIALDLGGNYTGMVSLNNDRKNMNLKGGVVVIDPDDPKFSLTERRGKRHQRRGFARYKLARRLLWVMLKDVCGAAPKTMDAAMVEWVNGLLRRRGFTFLSETAEFDESQKRIPVKCFGIMLPQEDSASSLRLERVLQRCAVDVDYMHEANDALMQFDNLGNHKCIKEYFKNNLDKLHVEDVAEYEDVTEDDLYGAYKAYKEFITGQIRAIDGGHEPRKQYFEDITKDIAANAEFGAFLQAHGKVTPGGFANLVGNVSNLQLRALRKYFNDPAMAKGQDRYDDARLHQVFFRWVAAWHCDRDSKEAVHRRAILQAREDAKRTGMAAYFCATPPERTIPPLEDQNNRRPETDHTLLLDEGRMERRFPAWQGWADALMDSAANRGLTDKLDEILQTPDRKPCHPCSLENRKRLYFLQRLLDRSKAHDPYDLRHLARERAALDAGDEQKLAALKARPGYQGLNQVLSLGYDTDAFLKFADQYYNEQRDAKSGLWYADSPDTVFIVSGINPPRKSSIAFLLVGALLGIALTNEQYEQFIAAAKEWKFGNLHFFNAIGKIEEVRKIFGNEFRSVYDSVAAELEKAAAAAPAGKGKKAAGGKATPELKKDNDVAKCVGLVAKAHAQLREYFALDAETAERFNDPFMLAQLYVHTQGDVRGFSKTCKALAQENAWRSTVVATADGQTRAARCVRMTADSVRPFDGMLARVLEREAKVVADFKLRQLRALYGGAGQSFPARLEIPCFLEENDFTFTEGIATLKKAKSKKVVARLAHLGQVGQRWAAKDERIKGDSLGLCPYTGQPLGGQHGEIDHIVPRSATRDFAGTVFNHEANLIYCSNAGNVRKGDRQYALSDLSPAYLQKVCGTVNVQDIAARVNARIPELAKERRDFSRLSPDDRAVIRHALFMPGTAAWREAMAMLNTQQKARVNGTQAYLAKVLRRLLAKKIAKAAPGTTVEFRVVKIPAETVSDLRRRMGERYPAWRKPEVQPIASHVRDAHLVLVSGLIPDRVGGTPADALTRLDLKSIDEHFTKEISVMKQQSRDPYHKERPESVRLFDATIYAEHFIPLWFVKDGMGFGFQPDQLALVPAKGAERTYAALKPFLRYRGQPLAKEDNCASWQKKKLPLYLHFDKDKVVEWLFAVSRNPRATAEEREVFALLTGLSYVTVKESLNDVILDKNNYRDADAVRQKIKTAIKVDCKAVGGGAVKGFLTAPFAAEWEKVLADPDVRRVLGKKTSEAPADFDWKKVCARLFPRLLDGRRHQRVRKDYSLPIISQPSGTLMRVRRRDWRGGYVYQLQATTVFNQGFAIAEQGRGADFAQESKIPLFYRSPNLALKDGVAAPQKPAVYFDQWEDLPLDDAMRQKGIANLSMAPNSIGRCYLRVRQGWEKFRAALGPGAPATPFDLRAEENAADDQNLPAKPRSKLFIEWFDAGEVVYSYIVTRTSKELKQAYNSVLAAKAAQRPDA